LQSFVDEFNIESARSLNTPAETVNMLVKGELGYELKLSDQTKYICGVGKVLHVMGWPQLEIYNYVRELSRFTTSGTTNSHVNAMRHVMEYCVDTEKRGIVLTPDRKWKGDPEFELTLIG
jgi:hypothetical protein